MQKIRVLVVDDSTVMRRLLSDALASDPELEIVGTAPNGRIALEKLPQLNPDVVTLDIEMPVMSGLDVLPELRKNYPKLPVIMFSTLTQKGAINTLNALSLGASDYVTKPSNVGSVVAGMAAIREQLIPKIKALCLARRPYISPMRCRQATPFPGYRSPARKLSLVAIGVSTGGPNALTSLLQQLPADFPEPIVIVQHMPPVFTRYLAERLNAVSPLRVFEAKGGELLGPGVVCVAPGDFHLAISRTSHGLVTRLHQSPPENSCRPAVDVLFRSVAEVAGAESLGLVLTGMGQDGLRGCEAIRQAGGRVLAQDAASSVVWGMPGAVFNAGLAEKLLPLDEIPYELNRLARHYAAPALATGASHA
jgi:two-component system chemotaxis response regulator CheB